MEQRLNEETVTRNKNENNNRKMNVEITGIPVTANESCKNIVANVGNLMGLDVDSNYFDVAHRLFQRNSEHIPAIIARF